MSLHEVAGKQLDGGMIDTLYKLYFFGAQESGDLPSKGGMDGLRILGWASTDWDLARPHRLTDAGTEIAKAYYDAKAEKAAEITQRITFTVSELKEYIDKDYIRWMTPAGDLTIHDVLDTTDVFSFYDVENNPAYTMRKYRAEKETPKRLVIVYLTFTISDRGTDCEARIIGA